jgi:G3E family GTPase
MTGGVTVGLRPTARPLMILAGFLGAGKTTFLRAVIVELVRRGLRPRIILNDLEDARVDGATLRDLEAEVAPVSGACLCCETQDALVEALRADGAPPHDVVLLETSGTTDTGTLLEILAEAPGLAHVAPPMQLTVIDAAQFGRRGWMNTIEQEQLRTSSHLKVSKRDLVSPARFQEVLRAARSAVPAASVAEPSDVADAIVAAIDDGAGASSTVPAMRVEARGWPQAVRGQGPHRPHQPHNFLSCRIELPHPIALEAMESFLAQLPAQVLRAKGVLVLREPAGEKRAFQWVSGQGGEVSPCLLHEPETVAPVAIFVGSGLDVADLHDRLMALRRD